MDLELITATLVQLVRDLTDPGDLSILPGSGLPAVIQAHQDGPIPDYPYITVDYLATSPSGSRLKNFYVDETDDTLVYENEIHIGYRITCHARDGLQIMEKVKLRFQRDSAKAYLCENAEVSLFRTNDVIPVPNVIGADVFNKDAFMDMTLASTILDKDINNSYVIDTIQITGDVDGIDVEVNT